MNDAVPESCPSKSGLPPDYPCRPEEREEIERWLNKPVSPALLEAEQVFRDQLPELLKTHRYQWVAYSGSQRLGFHDAQHGLYQECLQRGFAPGQFLIYYIDGSLLEPEDLVV